MLIAALLNWTPERVGDFDGDGDVDLYLKNGSQRRVWQLENNTFASSITHANMASGFETACSGDFDSDGDDDILLIHSTTDATKLYQIESLVRVDQTFMESNSLWNLLGCADYDGDGDADTLWTTKDGLGTIGILLHNNFMPADRVRTNS